MLKTNLFHLLIVKGKNEEHDLKNEVPPKANSSNGDNLVSRKCYFIDL